MKSALKDQVDSSHEMETQFCLLGNKKDKESERVVSSDSGKELAKSLGIPCYYEVSKECQDEFEWIFKKFLEDELLRADKPAKKKSETFFHKVKRKPGVVAAAVFNILLFLGIGPFVYFGNQRK